MNPYGAMDCPGKAQWTEAVDQMLGNSVSLPTARRLRTHAVGALLLMGVFTFSYFAAYLLRFEGSLTARELQHAYSTIALFLLIKTAIFALRRVTRVWHSYVSFHELVRVGQATGLSMLVMSGLAFMAPGWLSIPRSIVIFDGCITVLAVAAVLCVRRWMRERKEQLPVSDHSEPVLIVGVNPTGVAILRAIQAGTSPSYHPVGLVCRNPNLVGKEIGGVPVVGHTDSAVDVAIEHGASTLLIVAGELTGREVRQLMDQCNAQDISVRLLPNVHQILSGHVDFRPREVAIEDLLGREPVQLDQERLHRWLENRRVMVTGSCGSIGSEIARQLLSFSPSQLILVDRSETGQFFLEHELKPLDQEKITRVVLADMTDADRLRQVFETHQPEIVFHAAAYKHVPLMEQHPGEAVKNIVGATRNLVDLSVEFDVESFVMISTDKAVNPTSVMGCCKRVAELYVQASARDQEMRFVTVRFGNVLGSAGSVIPIFRRQIAAGGPVTITHPDMTRFFMTIPEASQLVIQAGAIGQGGDILVLDMGNPVRIIDLAEDMIRLSGLKPGLDIEIAISGLRPGEKLYEELYTDDEQRRTTEHPKILVAESEYTSLEMVSRQIDRLLRNAHADPTLIRGLLGQTVPRYQGASTGPLRRAA